MPCGEGVTTTRWAPGRSALCAAAAATATGDGPSAGVRAGATAKLPVSGRTEGGAQHAERKRAGRGGGRTVSAAGERVESALVHNAVKAPCGNREGGRGRGRLSPARTARRSDCAQLQRQRCGLSSPGRTPMFRASTAAQSGGAACGAPAFSSIAACGRCGARPRHEPVHSSQMHFAACRSEERASGMPGAGARVAPGAACLCPWRARRSPPRPGRGTSRCCRSQSADEGAAGRPQSATGFPARAGQRRGGGAPRGDSRAGVESHLQHPRPGAEPNLPPQDPLREHAEREVVPVVDHPLLDLGLVPPPPEVRRGKVAAPAAGAAAGAA